MLERGTNLLPGEEWCDHIHSSTELSLIDFKVGFLNLVNVFLRNVLYFRITPRIQGSEIMRYS